MTRYLILFLLLFFSVPLNAGTIPQYSFTDIEGKTYISTDLQGTAVVINIGSHW